MRTGKIARLPNDIREQLNRRLQDGEQGKSILKWLNALPEIQAVLKEHFDGHPVAASNLTEWKDGGYRDWQVRQDALAMVNNLGDEQALGDKALTDAFNEKLARWVSIHYAATAKAVLAAQLDSETKFSRLRHLCADVSRLRRSDYHAERMKIERQRLALQQSKADQDREEEFKEWLNRPEIQAKYFPKQKRGLSREALALVDNYLCEGISPLDPEEAAKLYPFGRYAVKPPIGFEMPGASNGASNQNPAPAPDPNQMILPFPGAAGEACAKNNPDHPKVGSTALISSLSPNSTNGASVERLPKNSPSPGAADEVSVEIELHSGRGEGESACQPTYFPGTRGQASVRNKSDSAGSSENVSSFQPSTDSRPLDYRTHWYPCHKPQTDPYEWADRLVTDLANQPIELKSFTDTATLRQIGPIRLSKLFTHFATGLRAANLAFPAPPPDNAWPPLVEPEATDWFNAATAVFTEPSRLPPRMLGILLALESAASPENKDTLGASIFRRLPCTSVTGMCPLDRALELWFSCPDELPQFLKTNGKNSASRLQA